ncbi:MAG: Uma2 family endonuclease [Candidatus Melainabacteria bacterium]|nr:Uma2 family endonuclease [Candidatus Melainabacteria bacterium]
MSEAINAKELTAEEYLEFEAASPVRHEYVQGLVFAMSGSTYAHNVIAGNFYGILHAHLRGSGCVAFMNDMKLNVKAADSFYYPDIMVTCEKPRNDAVFVDSPVLVVEILSPSTKQIDRREKMVAYRKLPSVKEYVLVHQEAALVEIHRREANGAWLIELFRSAEMVRLESMPGGVLELPVDDLYEGLDLSLLVKEADEEYQLVRSST